MSRTRLAVSAALVVAGIALITLLVVRNFPGSSSIGDEVAAFNGCLAKSGFLAVTKHRSDHRLVEAIRDRAHGGLVGEFGVFPSLKSERAFTWPIGPPSGEGAANGRLEVVTAGVVGRDANAIIGCETAPAFPVA